MSSRGINVNMYFTIFNDDGAPLSLGTLPGHTKTFYCSRKMNMPGSDGRCGPDNGPPCPSCVLFNTKPRSREIDTIVSLQAQSKKDTAETMSLYQELKSLRES